MSKVPFGVKDCGKTCSSDGVQVMYEERLKEKPQLKWNPKGKGFSCEVSGKEVSQKSHINFNMGVHTKEKPYNCEICKKTFPSKSDLGKHVDVHTEGKPYNCEIETRPFHINLVF
ncbi:zinc finger protein-like [Penaeus monodon]|uniref:zinc finger protein-like n=1 Tax=Penaeus monodon TaxID=6687 RepID=UPI0018A6F4F2|nr:zinc finger protein-like [Penaeus monodon]